MRDDDHGAPARGSESLRIRGGEVTQDSPSSDTWDHRFSLVIILQKGTFIESYLSLFLEGGICEDCSRFCYPIARADGYSIVQDLAAARSRSLRTFDSSQY